MNCPFSDGKRRCNLSSEAANRWPVKTDLSRLTRLNPLIGGRGRTANPKDCEEFPFFENCGTKKRLSLSYAMLFRPAVVVPKVQNGSKLFRNLECKSVRRTDYG
jgi:hypothetical protein